MRAVDRIVTDYGAGIGKGVMRVRSRQVGRLQVVVLKVVESRKLAEGCET